MNITLSVDELIAQRAQRAHQAAQKLNKSLNQAARDDLAQHGWLHFALQRSHEHRRDD